MAFDHCRGLVTAGDRRFLRGQTYSTVCYLSVDKALHGLCPLYRPQETPRVSWVDGLRILRGQTCSTVC
jgi:hypothetical protein